MAVEYSSFAGWETNLKLVNDSVEVIITLEVGPRIISYRPREGQNVFKLVLNEAGKSNEEEWKIRGGHRLWIGPDLGSNFEAFTNSEFLELETLGPLKRISTGETVIHQESWVVFSNLLLPEAKEEEALLHSLEPFKERLI